MATNQITLTKKRLSSLVGIGVAGLVLALTAAKAAQAEDSPISNNNGSERLARGSQSQARNMSAGSSQIKELAGKILIDAQAEVSQPLQIDKYVNFVNVSTPTLTPASGHSLLFASSAAKQFVAKFSDGTSVVLGSGSGGGVGTITGVTAGTDLTGGGTTGTVTLNVDPTLVLETSSATATYLQLSSATATYLQVSSATATYLQKSSATATYLTQSSATVTYLQTSSATATYLQATSLTATQPVLYNSSTKVFSATLISATTGLMGTLQAAQEPAHTGDITNSAGSLATTLASVVTANQFGSATVSPVITFDAKGRITAVSSATIAGSSGTGTFLQCISSITTSQTTTTSSTYQTTTLAKTITPASASNKILIWVTTTLRNANLNATFASLSVFRGATDLDNATGTNSLGLVSLEGTIVNSTSGHLDNSPASIFLIDSPATTSATTYTVKVKSTDNATSVSVNNQSSSQSLFLCELGQ